MGHILRPRCSFSEDLVARVHRRPMIGCQCLFPLSIWRDLIKLFATAVEIFINFFEKNWNFKTKFHTKAHVRGSFHTMESVQHLSRFAAHNLHLISCLESRCAPITTNSERCVFETLIWSSAQKRCVSGTRRDVWMQRLSRREAICSSAAFMTRYS